MCLDQNDYIINLISNFQVKHIHFINNTSGISVKEGYALMCAAATE